MKHIQYVVFLFALISLVSCEERPASGPGTMITKPVSIPVVTPTTTPGNSVPAGNMVSAAATTKLNPEHGKPGHRCDIAVGAPLNGPAQNTNATLANPPVINPSLQTTTPTLQNKINPAVVPTSIAVTPGINPAHGQPGHRCDVAVGATMPKTAAPTTKTATSGSPVVPPILQNSPILPQSAPTVASGLNPAHGQPGHRCDIEVGKPLSSAPKKNG